MTTALGESMPFGMRQPFQLGMLSTDLERDAIAFTDRTGAGPWMLIEDLTLPMTLNDGTVHDVTACYALTYWSDLQIEMIATPPDRPSPWRDDIAAGRLGLHHLGVLVDDLDAAVEAQLVRGGTLTVRGSFTGSPESGFAYISSPHPATVLELATVDAATTTLFEGIRSTCRTWDSSEPIRRLRL